MAIASKAKSSKTIPYVHEMPILGSLPAFMRKDRMNFLLRVAAENDVCGFHMGPIPIVLFNKAEHVHSILVEHAYDFSKGRLLHKAMSGNGLFISEGEFHRHQRRLIAPAFQLKHVASYADTMVEYSQRIQQKWQEGDTIDLNGQMIDLTMSIIGKVLFDADIFNETNDLSAAMAVIFEYTTRKVSSLFTPPLSWPTPNNLRLRKATQVVQGSMHEIIAEQRRSEIEHNNFLSILLQAKDEDGKVMSDSQLMDECLTLFAAGHETTASALTWTWYFLCQHPDVYAKVQQEVDTVLQGRTPTYNDLAHLPYCLQVFKETMRLYPPAAAILREALHDIEIDGYRVPKGYGVFLSPYTLQRNPAYFSNPEAFNPEHFTSEQEKQLPRYAYIPFGAGPRICIGNYFALMEGQLLIASLAQSAHFQLVPGQTIEPDAVHNLALRPGGKVEAIVSKR